MAASGSRPAEVGLHFLSTAYRLRRTVDGQMVVGGLSLARAKILQVLDRRGPLRQAALAAELGQAARSITQAVEAMEQVGLVARHDDPADGRAKVVTLTTAGTEALAAGTAAGERTLREIFGALDHDQLASLDAALTVIDDHADPAY